MRTVTQPPSPYHLAGAEDMPEIFTFAELYMMAHIDKGKT